MKVVKTYNTQIWVGSRVGNTDQYKSIVDVEKICDEYVSDIKLCVTITPTQFRYVNGNEPGWVIGLINYPRFEKSPETITKYTLELGEKLLYGLEQKRLTIITPEESIMLENLN